MTELRQRMDDAMVLRGFALRTRETYLACVAGLAKHYRCSPERLDAQQIQSYLLHLITEKKLAYASVNQAACACRFLFGTVLQQRKIWLDIPMAKVPKRLPVVLARTDQSPVRRLRQPAHPYRADDHLPPVCASPKSVPCTWPTSNPRRIACAQAAPRQGGKDRYTLLSPRLLGTLRLYWHICRPRIWLFPNRAGRPPD